MEQTAGNLTPTSVIAARVRELRQRRGWTADQLAEQMTAVGIPWTRIVVTKLETGRRPSVSVDEFLALAYVLDVAPVHLIVPPHDGAMRIVPTPRPHPGGLPNAFVATRDVRRWISGQLPLPGADLRVYVSEVDEETFRERFGHGSGWTPGSADGER